ncbi:MAG: hypothetical protein LM567_04710 [Desulfurococcaceae archaeon]|jgi:hypothetical protein|nr:hypothetical protein [Desulfurococcaceae archaeon]
MSCEICGFKQAVHECKICGRRVCYDDYNTEKGICSVCESALCQICGKYLSISTCISCGRQGCEECLVEISQVEYMCLDCLKKKKV